MNPIATKLTNDKLLPAPGTEDYVSVLPITRDGDMVSSCWKMNWWERLVALWTGEVWCDCLSRSHPPIRLRTLQKEGNSRE